MNKLWIPKESELINKRIEYEINNLSENEAIAFTDGSYSKKLNKSAYGVALFAPDKEIYCKSFSYSKQSHRPILNLCSVGAECEAVKFAIKKSIEKGMKSLSIYYDYDGIYKLISREWTANNSYTENFVDEILKYSKEIKLKFNKIKSHKGIYYNALADSIAASALFKP